MWGFLLGVCGSELGAPSPEPDARRSGPRECAQIWPPRQTATCRRGSPPINSLPLAQTKRSRDCNPEFKFTRECRYSPRVPSFVPMGGPGREGLGPAGCGELDRYCRPCRVPAHPHRWVAPHSTRGKTMDQPTQAVPIPRGHRPANCYFTCIAQRPPSGGAR